VPPATAPYIKRWASEALAILFAAAALFLLLSVFSSQLAQSGLTQYSGFDSYQNWMGPVGDGVGTALLGLMGWCAFVPALWIAGLSVCFFRCVEGT